MAGGIDWFRWHHGSVTDPKFALVARRSGARLPDVLAVWAFLLERASAADVRGRFGDVDAEAVDCLMGFDDGVTARILGELEARGLTADGEIANWDKRQPKREREDNGAAERQRQKRERDAAQVTNHVSVTPCHATSHQKTPREEKRREEEKENTEPPVDNSPLPTAAGAVCVLLRSKRIATVNPSSPKLKALLDAGTDIGAFAAAADIAVEKGHPSMAYVLGIVERQAEQAQRIAEEGLKAPPPARGGAPPLTVPAKPGIDPALAKFREEEERMKDPATKAAADAARLAAIQKLKGVSA